MDSIDSPEIPDKGRISDIPGLPSWGKCSSWCPARAEPSAGPAQAVPSAGPAQAKPSVRPAQAELSVDPAQAEPSTGPAQAAV